MISLVSALVRVAVACWLMHSLVNAFEDKEQREIRELRERIEWWRGVKEKVDTHVIKLESKYAGMVL